MDLNWEHKLKAYVSVCRSFSTSEISRNKGCGQGEGERRGEGSHMLRLYCKSLTSSKPVRAVAMGLPWVKGQPMLVPSPF